MNYSQKKYCQHRKDGKECGQVIEVLSSRVIAGKTLHKLKCGHMLVEERQFTIKQQKVDEVANLYDFKFGNDDEYQLMPFQKDGVKFLQRANFRALLADDPGLGKTFQFLAPLRLNPDKTLPCLIVCKAGLRGQIGRNVNLMTDVPVQVIYQSYHKPIMKKSSIVVISYDMIWRVKWDDEIWSKFKTIILDECQAIKNGDSNRTQKIKELTKQFEFPNRIAASATPIKNRGSEYFQILHWIAPEKFPTEPGFQVRWLEFDDRNRARGIKPGRMEDWKEFTKDIIIRRKKEDVLPDLPPVRRQYRDCDLAKEVEDAYDEEMKGFLEEYNKGKGEINQAQYMHLLAYISRMRHLVGISKVKDTLEEIDEVLLATNEKIVVFIQHIAAGRMLLSQLIQRCEDAGYDWQPTWLQGGMSQVARDEVIDEFTKGKSRVLIASTLASGEGVDGLQEVCGYAIMHERQWNPASEEQAEGRFSRIGSTRSSILILYMIAKGTIDEWITALIDEKRIDVTATLDGREVSMDEISLTREMMDIIAREGRKRWRLR